MEQQGAQIFCIGASISYGVGSATGGWPDLYKHELHRRMYGYNGAGETTEIYNLGIPGETTGQLAKHIGVEIAARTKVNRQNVVVISIGLNDSRAKVTANGYVSTPEDFEKRMQQLLLSLKQTSKVLAIGYTPVNENLTDPKKSPDGSDTYFTNQRIKLFEQHFQTAAKQADCAFVPTFDDALASNWQKECLYKDGLHANGVGQQWLYEKISPYLQEFLV